MDWARELATKYQLRYVVNLMVALGIDRKLPADLRKLEALYLINRFERRIMGLSRDNRAIRRPILRLVGGRDA